MQQYFAKNKNLELEKSDYHHIKNVMRMKKGEIIKVAYDNEVYLCKLSDVSNNVSFNIIEKTTAKNKEIQITVAFSLIKEQKLDYLLQKTTETGVDTLIPLETIRSVVKVDPKKVNSKLERWNKICKEASEQSFRESVPTILEPKKLKDLIEMDYDVKLVCSLNENTQNIKKVLQKINKCVKMIIVVGPEGGFDPKEEEMLINNGFISVSLGENVLRAETAPVVAISMINYEFMR